MIPVQTVTPVHTKRLWQGAGAELAGHNSTSVDPASSCVEEKEPDSTCCLESESGIRQTELCDQIQEKGNALSNSSLVISRFRSSDLYDKS